MFSLNKLVCFIDMFIFYDFLRSEEFFFENKRTVKDLYNQKRLTEIFQNNENVGYCEGPLEERYF